MRKATTGHTYQEVPYDGTLVRDAMQLWSAQGYSWVFGPGYFDKLNREGHLRLFVAYDGKYPVGVHPMEHFGPFMYAQPVLYDKKLYPEIARFMWFELMLHAHADVTVDWVDLGGGFHGSWVDFLHNRSDPKFRYKWQYVPEKIKEDPNGQTPYYAQRCACGYKQLVTAPETCNGCGHRCPSR